MLITTAVLPLLLPPFALAQLSLPNPPWLPPNASAGAVPAQSHIPNPQWSNLLGNLLYFYDAQKSGNLSSNHRVYWRNSSGLEDGSDVNHDLTGGFYDAGDYLKATFPLSFTLMSLCWGAMEFGRGYDLASQTPYLDDTLRWGLDWLMKAHPSNETLYVLVGDATKDHVYWGGDQDIPEPRAALAINATHPGTDAAAGASAAFSACSLLYSNRTLGDEYSPSTQIANSSYARTLLTHAQALHDFAVHASGGQMTYQTSVPDVEEAYGSSSYGDELAISALFLSWATNSSDLYEQAKEYYSSFGLASHNSEYSWDSKAPGVPILFTQLGQAGFGQDVSSYQSDAERYLDNIINQSGPVEYTKGGLLWYPVSSKSTGLNPALNAAMLFLKYAPLASSSEKRQQYINFADSQLRYALGDNPMNVPYVVGVNPNSPANPHSAMASGGNDIGRIDTEPAEEAYILNGAVVGGPDKHDRYFDIRSDWPQTEVALDYNAPMLTLVAQRVLTDSNDPFYTSLQDGRYDEVRPAGQPCDDAISDGCPGKGLSRNGRIALYVILAVVTLAIGSLVAYWLWVIRENKPIDMKQFRKPSPEKP